MYHKGYVILGIIIFLILLAMPYWVTAGNINYEDIHKVLAKPKGKKCIEDVKWMAANHMELLNKWREMAVRCGMRIYHTKNGVFNVSLVQCWKCHEYDKFCKRCHEFMEVHPVCWDCHYNPSMKFKTVNFLK